MPPPVAVCQQDQLIKQMHPRRHTSHPLIIDQKGKGLMRMMMLCSLVGSDDNSMNFKLEVSDIARLV